MRHLASHGAGVTTFSHRLAAGEGGRVAGYSLPRLAGDQATLDRLTRIIGKAPMTHSAFSAGKFISFHSLGERA
jgi:hypothetical protein